MPKVIFASHVQRHVSAPDIVVEGSTVRSALDAVFADNRPLRGYVLDDQGHLRKHVVVFVDGARVVDRQGLSEPVKPDSEIYVLQALSGG
ncbi:MAG: MoaD/ThiS family protein [Burkholderiales bacterium]|nr:MoaD/ThiS family protein [Burkholderiales bacterium]